MASPIRCYTCGFELGHINDACPQCLPGFYRPNEPIKPIPASPLHDDPRDAELASLRQQLAASQAREAEAYERAARIVEEGREVTDPHEWATAEEICKGIAAEIRALAGREG